MRLTVTQGQEIVTDKAFDAELVNIGHDWSCQLQLPDKRVAAQHALIVKDKAQWLIEPEDKSVVVMINQNRLASRQLLRNGDIIIIEPYRITFHDEQVGSSGTIAAVDAVNPALASSGAEGLASGAAPGAPTKPRVAARVPPDALVCHPTAPIRLTLQSIYDLGKISLTLGQCPDLASLISRTVDGGLSLLKAGVCYVNLRLDLIGKAHLEEGRNNKGQALDPPLMAEQLMPAVLERRTRILVGHEKRLPPNALCVPIACELGCIGTIYLEAGGLPLAEPELDIAAVLASVVGVHLERIIILRRTMLSSAEPGAVGGGGDFLKLLLPTGVPKRSNISLACFRKAGLKRSADWFDFLNLPDGKLAVAIAYADPVVRLPVVMGQLRAAFRLCELHNRPPHQVHRELHWLLSTCRECPGSLDLFTAVVDPASRQVQYCSSGQALAWILDRKGNATALERADHPPISRELKPGGEMAAATIPEGGSLFLCSPGAPDTLNTNKKRIGMEAVLAAVADGLGDPPADILNEVVQQLDAYSDSTPPPDDLTMILVKQG